jgi:hypothetical protein
VKVVVQEPVQRRVTHLGRVTLGQGTGVVAEQVVEAVAATDGFVDEMQVIEIFKT